MTGSPSPFLTVAIPTFNRVRFLANLLETLLLQATDDVELLVCDNASSDTTAEFLTSLSSRVRTVRHPSNTGADRNLVSCLEGARGGWIWLMGDDDMPCSNALKLLREGISQHPESGLFVLRTAWTAEEERLCTPRAVESVAWQRRGPDEFLRALGVFVTTMSGIVVRRDLLDLKFIKQHIGSNLTPAATMLCTVGTTGHAMVSEAALITCRAGNSGGYEAIQTFTTNLRHLLNASEGLGFSRAALRTVYTQSLTGVVPYIIGNMAVTRRELQTLVLEGWHEVGFYRSVVPALVRRLRRALDTRRHG